MLACLVVVQEEAGNEAIRNCEVLVVFGARRSQQFFLHGKSYHIRVGLIANCEA